MSKPFRRNPINFPTRTFRDYLESELSDFFRLPEPMYIANDDHSLHARYFATMEKGK